MEEFSFVVEGVGRMRIADQTIMVPKHGGVLVGPELLRQVFNDTEAHALWLIVGASEKELEPGVGLDQKLVDPMDPKQLPRRWAARFGPQEVNHIRTDQMAEPHVSGDNPFIGLTLVVDSAYSQFVLRPTLRLVGPAAPTKTICRRWCGVAG